MRSSVPLIACAGRLNVPVARIDLIAFHAAAPPMASMWLAIICLPAGSGACALAPVWPDANTDTATSAAATVKLRCVRDRLNTLPPRSIIVRFLEDCIEHRSISRSEEHTSELQ